MRFEKNSEKILVGAIIIIVAILLLKNSFSTGRELSAQTLISDTQMTAVEVPEEGGGLVYITGEIKKPGVYEFEEGERLNDIANRAGGFTDVADLTKINLAIRLEDEMKIVVPSVESTSAAGEEVSVVENPSTGKVNIRSASKEELMTLPGVGPVTADKIIEYRDKNGFEKIEDIQKVNGIGPKTFEGLKEMITVK